MCSLPPPTNGVQPLIHSKERYLIHPLHHLIPTLLLPQWMHPPHQGVCHQHHRDHCWQRRQKDSTKFDNATAHNCDMMANEYTTLFILVLSLCPGLQHCTRQNEHSFLSMLLDDFVTLTILDAVSLLDEPTDKQAIARILTHFSLLMLGANALTCNCQTSMGIERGSALLPWWPERDFAIIHCQLIS
jgi:hypothetical protein